MSWFNVLNLIGFQKNGVTTPVADNERLPVTSYPGSEQDNNNSTTTPLNNGSTYTGTPVTNDVSEIFVTGKTDQECTLYIDLSTDGGANYDSTITRNIEANVPYFYGFVKAARTYRIRITNNSGTNQTFLRHSTYFGRIDFLKASLDQTVGKQQECMLTRPTIAEDDIIRGLRRDATYVGKFGYSKTNSVSTLKTLWPDNSELVIMTSADTFDITYNNTTDGNGTTGATVLLIDYMDGNFELQQATHVLGGTGTDTTSFSGLGINRVVVVANGGARTNTNDIDVSDTTLGNLQARVPALNSVTQQSIFHIPVNSIGVIKDIEITAQRQSGGNPQVTAYLEVYNRFVNTIYQTREYELDTASNTELARQARIPLSGRDVIQLKIESTRADTLITFSYSLDIYSTA